MNDDDNLRRDLNKMKVLLVGSRLDLGSGFTPMLVGIAFLPKASVCSLRVLLDPVALARSFSCFLGKKALALINHALVTSQLDYLSGLYVGLALKMTQKLQMVQNATVCILMGATHFHHVTLTLAVHCLLCIIQGTGLDLQSPIRFRTLASSRPSLTTDLCKALEI